MAILRKMSVRLLLVVALMITSPRLMSADSKIDDAEMKKWTQEFIRKYGKEIVDPPKPNYAPLIILWSGLGILGTGVIMAKSARPEKDALCSLPAAIIGGPLFLLGNLAGRPQKLCPFCKSSVDRDATACPKCTKDIPSEADGT